MGERKGTNLYYPPDYDPRKGGINKFLGTHPLRERARKISEGILIIRFEMPFNIWCEGCGNHIGMGVRYNAEKKKIGNYFTTPIWSFRMKCHLCNNHFEIKTEPKTCEYIVVSGARRQENRWDPTENEQVVPEDKETSKRLFDDAMFKLEHGHGDSKQAHNVQPALAKLTEKREKIWHDDYAANSALRQQFRGLWDVLMGLISSLSVNQAAAYRNRKNFNSFYCQEKTKEFKAKEAGNSVSLQISGSAEERASKKRKLLLDLYEGHKIRHLKEMAEKSSLKLSLLGSVRKKSDTSESGLRNSTSAFDGNVLDSALSDKNSCSISLVSGAYDSSSSDDPT